MSSLDSLPSLATPYAEHEFRRVGFVATRISGTDGVSLEIGKWSEIFQRLGFDCRYIAGKSDRASEDTFLIEEADFQYPEIEQINRECFGRRLRSEATSKKLHELNTRIKKKIYEALRGFQIDMIIAQNSLTIPLNIPLGARFLCLGVIWFVLQRRLVDSAHRRLAAYVLGTLAIAGIYVDRVPELDYDRHLFRERSIVSTTANTVTAS